MTNQLTSRSHRTRFCFGLMAAVVPWLPLAATATTYYVATNGADTNPGTLGQPFLNIQKAATNAVAGDTVFIRGGTYRETVTPVNSGTISASITFQAYSNEIVTISGANIISNSWAIYSGNIYSNAMSWDLGAGNQVFLNGQMLIEARYPNTTLDVSHPVKLVATGGAYTGISGMQTGTVFNASLTQPTNYWVGGTINISIGKVWNSQTCPVVGSGTGQVSFAYTPGSANYLPTNGNPFFIFGKLSELESPGEWYFTNNILYLWSPQSDSPTNHLIEAKHRALGFNLSSNSWIIVSNINFFACAVATSSRTKNCVLNQLNMTYPVHINQMGVFTQGTNAGVILLGSSNVLQNSVIAFSAGSGVYVAGTNNLVTNNLIHDVDYSGNNGAGICTDAGYRVFGGTNTVIAGNTIYNAGGCPMDIGGLVDGYVHHNDVSLGGLQITDFGAIYAYTTVGQGTRIAYNLCHDVDAPSNNSGITNNNSKGIYLDGGSTGFVVDHNVIWNALTGIVLNSGNITNSAHLILNNTVLGDAGSVGWNYTPELGTVFQNNIFRTNTAFGPGSVLTNNLSKSTDPKFVNAAANNYQLQTGAPAIDAGLQFPPYTDGYTGANPDQGAYEYGQAVWSAGFMSGQQVLTWTTSGSSITEGAGTWNQGLASLPSGAPWYDGSFYGNTMNSGDNVVFGGGTAGTVGTITIGTGGVNPGNMTFNTPFNGSGGSGYTFGTAATPAVTMNSGLITLNSLSNTLFTAQLNGSFILTNPASAKGNLVLTANGTQTSGNIITIALGATLQMGNNSSAGSVGAAVITNNGTVTYRRSSTVTGNLIIGSGNVNYQLRGSTTTLGYASTYYGSTTFGPTGASAGNSTINFGVINTLPATTALTFTTASAASITADLKGYDQTLASVAGGDGTSDCVITSSSGSPTLTISGTNSPTTFSGQLSGSLGLTKLGRSPLSLVASNNYTGDTFIAGGTLQIYGAISNAAQVIVTNAATLQLTSGKITTGIVHIYTNAFLLGCGKITGVLINDGTMVSDCGTNVMLIGAVTNNGTMRITAGTQLTASGPFVNNGLLDIINAGGSLPPGFVNNGVVLDSSSVVVSQIYFSGPDVQMQIMSADGHTYQLQRSGLLYPTNWLPVGASQSGTGGVLTFTNSAALVQPQGFYRFQVN